MVLPISVSISGTAATSVRLFVRISGKRIRVRDEWQPLACPITFRGLAERQGQIDDPKIAAVLYDGSAKGRPIALLRL